MTALDNRIYREMTAFCFVIWQGAVIFVRTGAFCQADMQVRKIKVIASNKIRPDCRGQGKIGQTGWKTVFK